MLGFRKRKEKHVLLVTVHADSLGDGELETVLGHPIDAFRVSRYRTATTRVDYKVLQLLQSGGRGNRADTDLVRTEV